MCTVLLPPGDNPIAVNKCIIPWGVNNCSLYIRLTSLYDCDIAQLVFVADNLSTTRYTERNARCRHLVSFVSFSGEKVGEDTQINLRPKKFLSNTGSVSQRRFFQIGTTVYPLVMLIPAVQAGEVATIALSV